MTITQQDAQFVQSVARDFDISLTEAEARTHCQRILENSDRSNTKYEDFYYECKAHFLG